MGGTRNASCLRFGAIRFKFDFFSLYKWIVLQRDCLYFEIRNLPEKSMCKDKVYVFFNAFSQTR